MATHERQVGASDGNVVLDLFVLQQRIAELMELALADTGVRPAEYAVYSQLGISPLTPRELGSRLGVTASTLTGHLAALERRGHVRKVAHPEDRRSYLVELTDAGRRTLETCRGGFRAMLQRLEAGLSTPAAEVRAVLAGLERTAAAVAADLRAEVRTPPAAATPAR